MSLVLHMMKARSSSFYTIEKSYCYKWIKQPQLYLQFLELYIGTLSFSTLMELHIHEKNELRQPSLENFLDCDLTTIVIDR